jgi:hypothetical protein
MATSAKNNANKLTASSLKNVLWDTLIAVKDGKMDAGNADAVATQAREIIRTTNTQMRVAHQSKRPLPSEVINFSENV